MADQTPGRAFYEAYAAAHLYECPPWDELADDARKAIEAGAQAAIATVSGRD